MEAGEAYTGQMNLTLKSAKQRSFDSAYGKTREEIAKAENVEDFWSAVLAKGGEC